MTGTSPRRHRLLAALVGVALAAGAAVAVPAVAASPVVPAGDTTVTSDALPTTQIDGVAWTQTVAGNTVYVGGKFTSARPAGAPAGTSENPRSNLLAYDLTTGNLNYSFAPVVNNQVFATALSPDGSRLYVGGQFTTIDGQNRYRLAAFDTTTGALVSSFAPALDYIVKSIVVTSSTVYVGGQFSKVGSAARSRLAAFDSATGALLPWNPGADNSVSTMVMTPDGSRLLVGGSFATLGTTPAYGLGALDPVTGAVEPWAAGSTIRDGGANAGITSLSTDGTAVYGTGYVFGSTGDGNLEGAFSADPDSGTLNWIEDCHGDTYGVWSSGTSVYTVGHRHFCGNIGGFPETVPTRSYHHALAFTVNATGTVDHNTVSGPYVDWAGQSSPSLQTWFPDLTIGSVTGQDQAAWTVTGTKDYVLLGGEFPSVNGTPQAGLVRFATRPTAPGTQGPQLSGANVKPTVVARPDGTVRVSFPADYDRDDLTLTYGLTRDGDTAHPVWTGSVDSTFWKRPYQTFLDTGLAPGSTHTYRLSVTDPHGNRVSGDSVPVTVADPAATGAYLRKVLADGATTYLPMDVGTASGPTVADLIGTQDLATGSGVGLGAATGELAGERAATFDGTTYTGSGATVTAAPAPSTFTVSAWVNTTSTTGGKVVGYGSAATGNSQSYDRQIWLDNAGKVYFGVNPGSTKVISSATPVNDGQWHQLVASLGPAGMTLAVDGHQVAARNDVTSGQAYTGYWRVGGDNVNGWVTKPSSYYLIGSIDDVAIFPTPLSRQAIQDEYLASGRAAAATLPTDAYGAAVVADGAQAYWRLDETAGTAATDATLDGTAAIYGTGVVQNVAGALVENRDTAASFGGTSASLVSTATAVAAPTAYSAEAWFRTTSRAGGEIIGFGNARTGSSTARDRAAYVQPDGRVAFGYGSTASPTRAVATIVSPSAYNDGAWHHVVVTDTPTDANRLYVDGALVGSNATNLQPSYNGYWRIGGDSLTPFGTTATYLNGSIDEAAVYSAALTPAQVAAHFRTGTVADVAPTAAFGTTTSGLTAAFDASASSDPDGTVAAYRWDFGDGTTGAGPAVSHTYGAGGTYTVALTVTDNVGKTGTATAPVTVVAPNVAPTASFTSAVSGLTVAVDGSRSTDPDGTVSAWAWDYGDGTTGTGATTSHTYAASGIYTVTLTVTDDRGAPASATASVTPSAGPATYAADNFDRPASSGWGTAPAGGTWGLSGGAASFTTDGGAGIVTLSTAGACPTALLGAVSVQDSTTVVDTAVTKAATGNGVTAALISRRSGTSDYRLKVRYLSGGVMHLALSRTVAGTETALKEVAVPAISYNPGDVLRARFTVKGSGTTTLSGSLWAAGGAEPATPQIALTDTTSGLQGPGATGLQTCLSASATNAPVAVRTDNYLVQAAS